MSIQQLYTLLKKYREQRCTPEEWEELNRWYEQFSDEAEQISAIPEEKLEMLFARIENKIMDRESGKQRKAGRIRWYAGIAAALVVCFLGGRYFLSPEVLQTPEREKSAQPIQPGFAQAELLLEDGSRIVLDSTIVVKRQDGQLIKKQASPVLDYSGMKSGTVKEIYNTVSVPYGGEYRLILSDGTRIWLNSGSTLTYPVAFTGEKRVVSLIGEAYFEVTKSAAPFVVKTAELDVRVLGTSFNVSAYGNDPCVMTTLVTGCVEVCDHQQQQQFRIDPGHVLTYAKETRQVTLEECDTDLYTSWMRGEFKFRDMRLEDIMIKLNRWYNCDVQFADEQLKNLRFTGAAEKDRTVEYLLDMIRAVTDVAFEINGKMILVKYK